MGAFWPLLPSEALSRCATSLETNQYLFIGSLGVVEPSWSQTHRVGHPRSPIFSSPPLLLFLQFPHYKNSKNDGLISPHHQPPCAFFHALESPDAPSRSLKAVCLSLSLFLSVFPYLPLSLYHLLCLFTESPSVSPTTKWMLSHGGSTTTLGTERPEGWFFQARGACQQETHRVKSEPHTPTTTTTTFPLCLHLHRIPPFQFAWLGLIHSSLHGDIGAGETLLRPYNCLRSTSVWEDRLRTSPSMSHQCCPVCPEGAAFITTSALGKSNLFRFHARPCYLTTWFFFLSFIS